jgi:hypothetical protein
MVIWTRNHKKPVTQPPQPFVPTQPSPPIWLTAPIFIDGQKKEMDAFEWAVLASECGMPNLADMCVARMALVRKVSHLKLVTEVPHVHTATSNLASASWESMQTAPEHQLSHAIRTQPDDVEKVYPCCKTTVHMRLRGIYFSCTVELQKIRCGAVEGVIPCRKSPTIASS